MGNEPRANFGLPVEVQLAWKVMTCKAMRETYDDGNQPCRFFNRHFGPYPAYDWLVDQPPELLAAGASREFPAKTNGVRYSVPALAGGCRKAPIMTIGINPNMPSWQLNAQGGTWCYPYFDDIAEYATYYRRQTIYQERFSTDLIKASIDPATALRAPKAGRLDDAKYSSDEREIVLTIAYDGDQAPTVVNLPRGTVVTLDEKRRFQPGDLLAGMIKLPSGLDTTVIQETVGYYQRFAAILDNAEKKLKDSGKVPEDADLHPGEDVVLGDMVACASPGWTAPSGGIPDTNRAGISTSCCAERGWLALQYQQTDPAVVVFSGTSAFGMFRQSFRGVSFDPPLPDQLKGPYAWLRFTLKNRVMMAVQEGATPSRIVVSPHFSYAVNFSPVYAFTLDDWNSFKANWPNQASALGAKPNAGQVLISPNNPNATPAKMGPAWAELEKQYMAPYEMIANVIVEEFGHGALTFDSSTKHLSRTPGPCRFCANQLFVLPGGCPYGKLDVSVADGLNTYLNTAAIRMVGG